MEYVLTGLVLVLIFSSPVVLVPPGSEDVVERLGRFHRVLGPGWHLSKIPFIDRVARRYSTEPAVLDLPAVTGPSKEELPLTVVSGLSCQLTDSGTAYRAVKDVQQSLTGLAQARIGAALRDDEFDGMLAERGRFESEVRRRLEAEVRPWGVKILGFQVHSVTPPQEVIEALEERARRERAQREREELS